MVGFFEERERQVGRMGRVREEMEGYLDREEELCKALQWVLTGERSLGGSLERREVTFAQISRSSLPSSLGSSRLRRTSELVSKPSRWSGTARRPRRGIPSRAI